MTDVAGCAETLITTARLGYKVTEVTKYIVSLETGIAVSGCVVQVKGKYRETKYRPVGMLLKLLL
jgi:hypothetical protein